MSVKLRKYNHRKDFKRVGEFYSRHYLPENRDGNFFLPAWEYAHCHPMTDPAVFRNAAVWEDGEEIVGVAHPEMFAGEAFFGLHPRYQYLKAAMLDYALQNLRGKSPEGRKNVLAFINDFDTEFESLAAARGFTKEERFTRSMTQLSISRPFPPIKLPDGFKLISLAEDNNLVQVTRVFWRGFNHGAEPPDADLAGRKLMQSAPSYRKDLNIAVVAPDGRFVSYAGLWFEPVNKFAYVEPVCTDPDYRLRGLAKAAILEGIRRCGELGATVAYVGSTLPIYLAMGFKKIYTCNCWLKHLD